MSKAFTKERDDEEDDDLELIQQLPMGQRNYVTPSGYQRLRDEYIQLLDIERPALVQTVSWAASNGDRSENGDYIYGKKRLREIDKRLRFLAKRLEHSEVVDPLLRGECNQVFFGATVTVEYEDGTERTYSIVGVDEADPSRGRISWISPLARALLKARKEESVSVQLPNGVEELYIVKVAYAEIA